MPAHDDDDGVTLHDNPLWSGRYQSAAEMDYNDDGVEWTSNPLLAGEQMTANPLWSGAAKAPSKATGKAGAAAMAHWADVPVAPAPPPLPASKPAPAEEDEWWNVAAPRVRSTGAPPPPPSRAVKSGISDSVASAEYLRKQQQQGMRVGPREAASGFGGHSGGKRAKPTVAPELVGAAKDQDAMRHVAKLQRDTIDSDMAALGRGRAPQYRGKDAATADVRSIVEDPRFAKNYQLDRESDTGNAASRYVGNKIAGAKEFLASDDKASQIGKGVARKAVRSVPVVGSAMSAAGAVGEHDRAALDENIAANPNNDDFTRAMATGLASGHRSLRNKEAFSAVTGVVKDGVKLGTGGLAALTPDVPGLGDVGGHAAGSIIDRLSDKASDEAPELAKKGLGKGAGLGYKKVKNWIDGRREAHEIRPDAVAPENYGDQGRVRDGTDRANEALLELASSDKGELGSRMLNHLNADLPALDSHQSILDAARSGDARGGDHTLRPSQVARVMQGEKARQRHKDRLGLTLQVMTENEDRGWWENRGDGPAVKQPKKP